MDYDRLEFLDAVEELAKRAGMEVPRETRRNATPRRPGTCTPRWSRGRAVLPPAARRQPQGARLPAKRGVDAATQALRSATRRTAGTALQGRAGHRRAPAALLDKRRPAVEERRGRVYDKFRDRVMFPIHDRRGRVIAFGGRVLDGKDDGPKYLNSPETAAVPQGPRALRPVAGAPGALEDPAAGRGRGLHGRGRAVPVRRHQAVATLGTATTPDHAELLFRNAPTCTSASTATAPAARAAWKALESVLPRMRDGRQAFFLFLPEGEDPDTIVRSEGAAGFDRAWQQATPLSEFFFAELGREPGHLDGKARLAERAGRCSAQMPDGAFRDLMRQRLARPKPSWRCWKATATAKTWPR
jgi:DNA primase